MTGAQLKQLREDLGEAIGRKISVADMAKLCGMSAESGPDQIRRWERRDGPSGPVATLLSIMAYACEKHPIPKEITLPSDDFVDYDDSFRAMMRAEILRRLS